MNDQNCHSCCFLGQDGQVMAVHSSDESRIYNYIAVDTTAVPERGIKCLAILAYCNVLIYFVSAFYALLMRCTLRQCRR